MIDSFEKLFDSNLVSSIVGGLISALVTYIAVKSTIQFEVKKKENEDKNEIRAVCLAIKTEMECILNKYLAEMQLALDEQKEGDYFGVYFPLTEDYFSIYHSNTSLIGKIDSDEVRSKIVEAYIYGKGLLDSYRYNNEMLENYAQFVVEHVSREAGVADENRELFYKTFKKLHDARLGQLVQYAGSIKEAHAEAMERIDQAIESLNKYLNL